MAEQLSNNMEQEFEHYFRLCLDRELTSEEARTLLFSVSEVVPVVSTDEEVAMIYHVNDEGLHCYDVNLEHDVSGDEGDQIYRILEQVFEDDDFECESSMDSVSEQQVLNRALLEQLTQKFI